MAGSLQTTAAIITYLCVIGNYLTADFAEKMQALATACMVVHPYYTTVATCCNRRLAQSTDHCRFPHSGIVQLSTTGQFHTRVGLCANHMVQTKRLEDCGLGALVYVCKLLLFY